MKRIAVLFLVAGLVPVFAEPSPTPSPSPATPTADETPLARSRALELAGAFANEGYKIRDGFWSGSIEKDKPVFIQINVFAGNEYWFCAAATGAARKLSVSVFDENGKPVEGEIYEDGASAAAGLVPESSGPRIVRVLLTEGEKSEFCLVYAYK
ncbi:MAG: hypothetical protein SFU53_02795 [Terrimicrobiaceae bacterium]|nr:hypothetical protein [Terrimicrobiaceae bacterium]